MPNNSTYTMQLRWGGDAGNWQPAGNWTFPSPMLALNLTGTSDGTALSGTVLQQWAAPYTYDVTADWVAGAQDYSAVGILGDNGWTEVWNFGDAVIYGVAFLSSDNGNTITGWALLYPGDGPLDIQGSLSS
jgi:hypothetical protein